jgi:predicted DNA-binding transcriptional regulator YafY
MSLLKYLERAKRMDDLIRRKATGNAQEFGQKLGISRSVLMEHLRDMKELGAPIRFCDARHCYYYENDFNLMKDQRLELSMMGGKKIIELFNQS